MLRLDYEALADSSRTLIEQGDIFEECIERMTQVIDKKLHNFSGIGILLGSQIFGKQKPAIAM